MNWTPLHIAVVAALVIFTVKEIIVIVVRGLDPHEPELEPDKENPNAEGTNPGR